MMKHLEFTTWLLQEMERRDWSQAELSRRSGIARPHINRIISGDRLPGFEFYRGVSDAFRIPLIDVLVAAGEVPDPITTFEDPTVADLAQRINALDESTKALILDTFYTVLDLTIRGPVSTEDPTDTVPDNIIQLTAPPQTLEDFLEYFDSLPDEIRDIVFEQAERSRSASDSRQSQSNQSRRSDSGTS